MPIEFLMPVLAGAALWSMTRAQNAVVPHVTKRHMSEHDWVISPIDVPSNYASALLTNAEYVGNHLGLREYTPQQRPEQMRHLRQYLYQRQQEGLDAAYDNYFRPHVLFPLTSNDDLKPQTVEVWEGEWLAQLFNPAYSDVNPTRGDYRDGGAAGSAITVGAPAPSAHHRMWPVSVHRNVRFEM